MKQQPRSLGKASSGPPLLQRAIQLHQIGQFDEADRLYGAILQLQPANAVVLHKRGLLHFRRGRNDEALQCLGAVVGLAPKHAVAWSDLGVIHAACGRLEDAVACYDRAIALDRNFADAFTNKGNALAGLRRPHDALASYERALAINPRQVSALNNRGGLLRELGRPAEALASLDKALAIKPDSSDALNNRGNAMVDLGRPEEALLCFDKALAANPTSASTLCNRGNALRVLSRPSEALASYDKALAFAPGSAEIWNNRGHALADLKRYDEAMKCSRRALSLRPDYAKAFNSLGNVLMDIGHAGEALTNYEKALGHEPDFGEAHANRARALIEIRRYEDALESCDRALALKPDVADIHNNRGSALARLGREDEAIVSFDKAIALKPDYAVAHDNKGVALLQLGRLDDARASIGLAIRLEPLRARSYHHFALSKRFTSGDPIFAALETLTHAGAALGLEDRIYAHFALGKAYADIEDDERSFQHFSRGAALKRGHSGYDEAEVLSHLERTRATCTSEMLARHRGCGDPSAAPVFIVGMPRSGTTLIEQILASHPDMHGAGEVNDFDLAVADLGGPAGLVLGCPEGLAQMSGADFHRIGANYLRRIGADERPERRIANKMTENFRFAGLIALALPNARILHVRRDPLDTCVSCFSNLFLEHLPYTYDLAELGRYYRAYEALMSHWREALPPGMMIDVQYEDVVADLEGQGRRLLAHCGLSWDSRCLDFHNHGRSVRTASVAQVRRPLYQSSVGRWRRYAAHLAPLFDGLGLPSNEERQAMRDGVGAPSVA